VRDRNSSPYRLVIQSGLAVALLGLGVAAATTTFAPPVAPPAPTAISAPAPIEPAVSDLLRPGRRALSAVFVEVRPPDSPVRAGELADVAAVFRKGDDLAEDATVVLRDVPVLAVGPALTEPSAATDSPDRASETPTPDAAATPSVTPTRKTFARKTFAIEVAVEDAQLITLAQQRGELRIGRCSTAACDDRDLTAP
jgi:Flp pilus assembly protein CpaB